MEEFLSDNNYLFDGYVLHTSLHTQGYMIYPTLENLLTRLEDPEYLNYSLSLSLYQKTERKWYLEALSKRPDLTETQKRLIKMYQSKL
jgi:hypothetical protein